ncbi:hypothetical protein LTR67_010290 [Exophiala xenobiotica]
MLLDHPYILFFLVSLVFIKWLQYLVHRKMHPKTIPLSVNYHFTRKCNYECGFCFHTDTNSYIAPLPDAKAALSLLALAGMKKINFAGGEPFLYARHLGELVDYCKETLHLESVSIVSNGSHIREDWLKQHAHNLDILAVSCDSFDEPTNIAIGRGKGTHIAQLYRIADWCRTYGVLFKLNSVINRYNWQEDMNSHIAKLDPYRWKCFQVLLVEGENDSDQTKRDARKFTILDEEFEHFCSKHRDNACFIPESNKLMAKSYLILDEHLRFLDRTGKAPSRSIIEVGVEKALSSVFWDADGFKERGGIYAWNQDQIEKSKEATEGQNSTATKGLGLAVGNTCGGSQSSDAVDMEDIGSKKML